MDHVPKYSRRYSASVPTCRPLLRRRRLLLALTTIVVVTFFLFPYNPPSDSELNSYWDSSQAQSPLYQRPLPGSPRISVITIWEESDLLRAQSYKPFLPNFVESFRTNEDAIELVWIGIQQEGKESCHDPTQSNSGLRTSNVKLLCFSRVQFWTLHRDYFCERWRCSEQQSDNVLRTMLERHDQDLYLSSFRLWRGFVFRKFIDPGVQWWGWATPDTFMGSFRSQFPWDAIAFDAIIPSQANDGLLSLRAQLCFFRARAETEAKLNDYSNLISVQAYEKRHVPSRWAMEEAEFSSFLFGHENITFLVLPQIVNFQRNELGPTAAKFATLHGTYRVQDVGAAYIPSFPRYPVLALPGTSPASPHPSSFSPTFSFSRMTRAVEIFQGAWEGDTSFPIKFSTHYNPSQAPIGTTMQWRRIVGRGGSMVGGEKGVWERFEKPAPSVQVSGMHDSSVQVALQEGLYIHWSEEERDAAWPNSMPMQVLLPNEALVSAHPYGAVAWDCKAGEVSWRGEESA